MTYHKSWKSLRLFVMRSYQEFWDIMKIHNCWLNRSYYSRYFSSGSYPASCAKDATWILAVDFTICKGCAVIWRSRCVYGKIRWKIAVTCMDMTVFGIEYNPSRMLNIRNARIGLIPPTANENDFNNQVYQISTSTHQDSHPRRIWWASRAMSHMCDWL